MRYFLIRQLSAGLRFARRHLTDLLSLFYPALCPACDHLLPPDQQYLCIDCQYRLPATAYHLLEENPFTERFWGRLQLTSGASLYHFVKGGRTQRIIHQIKYGHRPEIAYQLGLLYGKMLLESPFFRKVEYIVPVPLHPRRQHHRGYNQSDHFARGLAESMRIPWSANVLRRCLPTASQTRKSRMERFDNVQSVFELLHPERIAGRHVLLVDDVITTGATLEACGRLILQVPGTRLSMVTLAFAN